MTPPSCKKLYILAKTLIGTSQTSKSGTIVKQVELVYRQKNNREQKPILPSFSTHTHTHTHTIPPNFVFVNRMFYLVQAQLLSNHAAKMCHYFPR